jgi:hypothetical protein
MGDSSIAVNTSWAPVDAVPEEDLDSATLGVLTTDMGDIGAATLVEVVDITFCIMVGDGVAGKLGVGIHLMERLQQPS